MSSNVNIQVYGSTNDNTESPNVGSDSAVESSTMLSKLEHFIIILCLAVASYVGVISRIYLSGSYISSWDGIMNFDSLLVQILGSGLIGYLVFHKKRINKILYIALATGLCGSLTTFSTWNSEAAIVLLQLNKTSLDIMHDANYITGAVSWVTVLILGIGMPVASFFFGRKVAKLSNKPLSFSKTPKCCNKKLGCLFAALLFVTCTVCIIVACMLTNDYYILFSLLFSPFGTYLRWCLSNYFDNCFNKKFPIGTVMANYLGSLILALSMIARLHVSNEVVIINGIITGFCGSLTTVSTFISQIVTLSFPMSILYIVISLTTVQISYVIILLTYSLIGSS